MTDKSGARASEQPMIKPDGENPRIAYFSMEIGLESDIHTYAGGLGVLAGDILRSAADLAVPMIGVTLVYRQGHFNQELDPAGNQLESPHPWSPEEKLEPLAERVSVEIEGRTVHLRTWLYRIIGEGGFEVPVLLLDSQLPENTAGDQALTDQLYGGDARYRLCQEAILGLGGAALLRELGYNADLLYHMNEGHSSLLTLALLEEKAGVVGHETVSTESIQWVKERCVFTTHTPVAAGHDRFPVDLVEQVLGPLRAEALREMGQLTEGTLNMTHLGLDGSRYVNGVAMRHAEVSREMFPDYTIDVITNGAHVDTWTSEPIQKLFDRHIPRWRHDKRRLRYAIRIPLEEIREAHQRAKTELVAEIGGRTGVQFAEDALTLGFARRATGYKRADLLLQDVERLRGIAREVGPLQVVYAGRAHPQDSQGKAMIQRIVEIAGSLGDEVKVVYLAGYDMELAKLLVSGVDVWLNTPLRPREASGTSGMKAAFNGVPNLSVLDGWWVEGHIEGVTGWSLLDPGDSPDDADRELAALYDKLEQEVMPLYYQRPAKFAEMMRSAIALNASFFNTQRVVSQYVRNAYCWHGSRASYCGSFG
ncbi:MAG: alpha-glucan family phosphorylase [Anaerolineales bacterium]